jgi:anti-sigma-K factor RskA
MTIDAHSLLAPYALDALDSDERAAFLSHLEQCDDCRAELAGFQETAARLGEAQAQQPPAALRERLLSTISTVPQERPVVVAMSQRGRLRRTLPRLAAAAAVVVGMAGVGGYVVEREHAEDEREQREAISAVLADPDADTIEAKFETGGNVRLISSPTHDTAVIVANDLPRLDDDKVYQVWMVAGDDPHDEGTFETGGTMVMEGVSEADEVAITIEPAGGSKKPSSPPVARIEV